MKVEIECKSGLTMGQMIKPSGMEKKDMTALKFCVNMSEVVYSASIDGQGACLWGLIPPTLISDKAYVWLFTTDLGDEHPFLLARYSQMIVEEMLEEHPILIGHCHATDHRAQKWLRWLGAEFSFPDGKKIPFTIRRKHG